MFFHAALLLSAVPEGRVFGLDQQTLIQIGIQLFNACLLAVVLGVVLYKPVKKFMRARADRIGGQLREAQDNMQDAEKIRAEYEKKLLEIDAERLRILEAARLAAAEHSRHIIEDVKREAAEIRRRAHESAKAERERLEEDVRLQIIDISSLMAEKFVAHAMDRSDQDRMFDEAMAQMEEATWPN